MRKQTSLVLRSSKKIKFIEKLTRKTTVQKSPFYRGISLWNSLTPSLQKENTLLKFKKQLKNTFPGRYAQIVHVRGVVEKRILPELQTPPAYTIACICIRKTLFIN